MSMYQNNRKQFQDMEYFFMYVAFASERVYGNEELKL